MLTCGIFLINQDEKILVCHPTNSHWNSWGIPKGLPDPGEDTKTAAIRELLEETSIELHKVLDPDRDLFYLGTSDYKNRKKILVAYWGFVKDTIPIETLICSSMVTNKGNEELQPEFPEVDKYQWISLEEAKNCLHLPQRNILPKLIEAIIQSKVPKVIIKKNSMPVQNKIKIIQKFD